SAGSARRRRLPGADGVERCHPRICLVRNPGARQGRIGHRREANGAARVSPLQTVGRRLREVLASARGESAVSASSTATVFCFGQSNSVCLLQAWFRRLYRPADHTLRFKFILTNKNRFPGHTMVVRSAAGTDAICDVLATAFDANGVASAASDA